jgi:hypothetical protein
VSHVKAPPAAGKDVVSVLYVQHPAYLSSIRTLPPSTVPPAAAHVTLKASPVEKIKEAPGAGDTTLRAPPERASTGVVAVTVASARDSHLMV